MQTIGLLLAAAVPAIRRKALEQKTQSLAGRAFKRAPSQSDSCNMTPASDVRVNLRVYRSDICLPPSVMAGLALAEDKHQEAFTGSFGAATTPAAHHEAFTKRVHVLKLGSRLSPHGLQCKLFCRPLGT